MFNELLVLGQIPGTDIQITFNQLIALACICMLGWIWHRNPGLFRYIEAKAEFRLAIFRLRFQQPVRLIERIG